jgi:hypothetical protein
VPKLTPQQAADKWATNAAGAGSRYSSGVQNTTKDVVGRALAQEPVLLQNFTNSITSGHWRRKLGAVGTAGWKSKTVAKAGNYGQGINAAKDKTAAAFSQLFPYIDQLQGAIEQMPSGTLADSVARATAWIQGMAAYKAQE